MQTPRERPLLFSEEMIRAIQLEVKTVTRRLITNPSETNLDLMEVVDPSGKVSYRRPEHDPLIAEALSTPGYTVRTVKAGLVHKCPLKAGDTLWVREAYQVMTCGGGVGPATTVPKGTSLTQPPEEDHVVLYRSLGDESPWWRSPIHMPRWASRITLEVLHVDVQRLQDLTQQDCISEGMTTLSKQMMAKLFPEHHAQLEEHHRQLDPAWDPTPLHERTRLGEPMTLKEIERHQLRQPAPKPTPAPPTGPSPRERFEALWNHLHPKNPWATNPLVYVITFRRVP